MSKARTTLIEQVFKKLDRTGDGEITVKDIKGIYNVRSHPQYQNGECTEEELLKKFLSKFESTKGRNGKVSASTFTYSSGTTLISIQTLWFIVGRSGRASD